MIIIELMNTDQLPRYTYIYYVHVNEPIDICCGTNGDDDEAHRKTRWWQVLSQGYGQSTDLTAARSKYQSPTASAIGCTITNVEKFNNLC